MVAHPNQLSILQYNIRKSRTVMVELFDNEKIYNIDIIAIQEPWRNINTNTSYHPLKDRFNLVYLYHNDTRVCFYINKRFPPEKRGGILREIQPTPSKQIRLLHSRVKRAKTSLITQIRTEKIGLKAFLYSRWVPGVEEEICECGARQTARHILHECRLFSKKRREWWAEERRKVKFSVITHKDMLTKPRYASMAADFMRSTGLIGQYQVLEEDQQQGFTRVCGQKEGHGQDERASA